MYAGGFQKCDDKVKLLAGASIYPPNEAELFATK